MSTLRTWPEAHDLPRASWPRRLAARALMAASTTLSGLALRLATPPATGVASYPAALQAGEPRRWAEHPQLPQLEFHAEADGPHGAIYANGELVGWLPGVTRL